MNNDQFDHATMHIMSSFAETLASAIAGPHADIGELKDDAEADITAGLDGGEKISWLGNYEKCVA